MNDSFYKIEVNESSSSYKLTKTETDLNATATTQHASKSSMSL